MTSVVAVVHRGDTRWVYLDAGVFTGLVETLDEAIRYRLETDVAGPTGPCVLAGPTCDSADVLYEKQPVHLPLALAEGRSRRADVRGRLHDVLLDGRVQRVRAVAHRARPGTGACVNGATRGTIASHAVAAVGMSLPWPLLVLLVWERAGDGWVLGVAGAARMLPYVALSWAAGRLADRYARDRIVRLTLLARLGAALRGRRGPGGGPDLARPRGRDPGDRGRPPRRTRPSPPRCPGSPDGRPSARRACW